MLPDTITPDDLAALLGISTASMRDLAKRGIVIAPVAGSTRRGRAGAATARTFANWRLVAAKRRTQEDRASREQTAKALAGGAHQYSRW